MKLDLPSRQEWRVISFCAVVIIALLAIYHTTFVTLVRTLLASDSFSHGFAVPFGSILLAWAIRKNRPGVGTNEAQTLSPWKSAWPGMTFILICGIAWVIADLAGVNAGTQFMLVGLIAGCFLSIFGLKQFSYFLFPIAFLLFSVPFGEFLIDDMMIWTADATIWLLRLSGLAVFRDGLHFQLPSGRWSVVEACSGLNYLLASLPLGAVFAFTSYSSNRKRWIFMLACLIVPIVANWLRAYMIVMIGHYSGMTLAVGVDHLIYGWLFFGLVIGILFWMGAKWIDPRPKSATGGIIQHVQPSMPSISLAFGALALASVWPISSSFFKSGTPEVSNLASFSSSLNSAKSAPTIDFKPSYSGYQASEHAEIGVASGVDFFAALYSRQHPLTEMISWSNVLVTTEKSKWFEAARQQRQIDIGYADKKGSINLIESELRSLNGTTLLVWSWYCVGREPYSKAWQVKFASVFRLLRSLKDDSYFFSLQTVVEGGDREGARRRMLPQLKALGERFDSYQPTYGKH